MALSEDDFYTAIHRATLKRRSTGLMAGAIIGLSIGFALGGIGAFIPFFVSAAGIAGAAGIGLPAMSAVADALLMFGSAGAFTGVVVGTETGAAAGAAAALFNMQERLAGKNQDRSSLEESIEAAKPKGSGEYFNWKVSLSMGVLFAAFGALMAFSSVALLPATLPFMMGIAANTPAAVAATAGVMGLMGTSFGINVPLMTAQLSNVFEKILTGKFFSRQERSATKTAAHNPALDKTIEPAVEKVVAQELPETWQSRMSQMNAPQIGYAKG